MTVLNSHYLVGLFSEDQNEILHRANNSPGYSYTFKDTEELSPMPRFQTIRFKAKENAEQFIKDLQDKPDPSNKFSEEVAVFLSELEIYETHTPINESRTLDYVIK